MEQEFDIVIDALSQRKESLMKITNQNMEMGLFGAMDQIRLEQIQELNEAMGMWLIWKEEKSQ